MGKSSGGGRTCRCWREIETQAVETAAPALSNLISRLPSRPSPRPRRSSGRAPADSELCSPALGWWAPGSAPPRPPARPGTPPGGLGSRASCKVPDRVRRRPPRALRRRAHGSPASGGKYLTTWLGGGSPDLRQTREHFLDHRSLKPRGPSNGVSERVQARLPTQKLSGITTL